MSGGWEHTERDRAKVWRRYIRFRRAERRVRGMGIYCPMIDDDLEGLLNRLERAESVLRDIVQTPGLGRSEMLYKAREWKRWKGYRNPPATAGVR